MKYNSQTITLKTNSISVQNLGSQTNYRFDKDATELRGKAIAILLGEYNKYGREIDLEKYEEIKNKFENAINEIENLL